MALNLADPTTLGDFLERHGLSPRKGLGQHFLCSSDAVSAILSCLPDIRGALEIGPGPGVLTGPLSERLERVVALEIDPEMVAALRESAPKAEVRRADALRADIGAVLSKLPSPRAVVSNMPYNITGPLTSKIASISQHFDKAVLMMQKEVGQRFLSIAGEGSRGSISVYLEALFKLRSVAFVPASGFLPPPKVESVIIEMTPLGASAESAELFAFVRRGFTQPRKTLANNLASHGRDRVLDALQGRKLSPLVRPHELTLEDWRALYGTLHG